MLVTVSFHAPRHDMNSIGGNRVGMVTKVGQGGEADVRHRPCWRAVQALRRTLVPAMPCWHHATPAPMVPQASRGCVCTTFCGAGHDASRLCNGMLLRHAACAAAACACAFCC